MAKWKKYEADKRKLQKKQLPPGEYEKEIKRISRKRKV